MRAKISPVTVPSTVPVVFVKEKSKLRSVALADGMRMRPERTAATAEATANWITCRRIIGDARVERKEEIGPFMMLPRVLVTQGITGRR